eukprot:50267_1
MAEATSGYQVGDKVELPGKPKPKKGQVIVVLEGGSGKYKKFAVGRWYGIRLTEKRGDTDGRYKGEDPYFFKCEKNFGTYKQNKDITKKITDDSFDFLNETKEIEAAKEKENEKYKKESAKNSEMMSLFKKYDDGGDSKADEKSDGDKSLNQAEWINFACNELKVDETDAKKLFRNIDVSGNGSISLAELDAFFSGGGRAAIDKIKQYAQLKIAFKDADKDGNLSLDVGEFIKLADKSMGLKEVHAKVLFINIDVNENGDISFEEFNAYVDDIGGTENFDVYRKMIDEFKKADKDGSNSLDGKEFVKLLKEKFGYNKFKAQRVFVSIDTDKSETISLKEFEAWVKKIGGVKALQKKINFSFYYVMLCIY